MVKKLTDDFSLHFLKCKWKWTNISNHSLVLMSYFVFVFLSLCQYAWVCVSQFVFVSVRLSLCLGVWQLWCWALGVEQLQWVMATLPVLVSPASELHPAAASPTLHKHKHKQKHKVSHTQLETYCNASKHHLSPAYLPDQKWTKCSLIPDVSCLAPPGSIFYTKARHSVQVPPNSLRKLSEVKIDLGPLC